MDEMIELQSNDKRRAEILSMVAELTPETRANLKAWADAVCMKYNAIEALPGEESIYMDREMAIELIVTTYFCNDWYPERTRDWLDWNGAIGCK
jgi:hypothetical protein